MNVPGPMLPSAIPPGYAMMHDPVGKDCTDFAVEVLHGPTPMGGTVQRAVDGRDILAHVEPHTWTNQGGVRVARNPPIRGVTLYERQVTATPSPTTPAPPTIPSPPPAEGYAAGCDVSHYQGTLQWADLAKRGCVFTYLKASEGAGMGDTTFAANADHARGARVLRGAYHFFRPAQDVDRQAALFLRVCQSVGPLELPPALDVEVSDNVSAPDIAAAVERFVDLITPALGRPVIYTSPGWWRSGTGNAKLAAKADLWVAHWTDAAEPALCGDWTRWLFWQRANRSVFAGDGDVYAGTADELRAAFGQ